MDLIEKRFSTDLKMYENIVKDYTKKANECKSMLEQYKRTKAERR